MDNNIFKAATELVNIRNAKIDEMKTAIDDMVQQVLNKKIELLASFCISSDTNEAAIWTPIRFYISFPIQPKDFPTEITEYAQTHYFLQVDRSISGIVGFEKIINLEDLDEYIKNLNT